MQFIIFLIAKKKCNSKMITIWKIFKEKEYNLATLNKIIIKTIIQ